uniref:IF rod domain-containing protein n=1 Tax=Varanus komodoensis TaxID=61221 RepID=A0A8D2LM81_VARKO
MSRQCFSSRSLNGRWARPAGSAISRGFHGGNSLSSICYTGAGKCGGYSSGFSSQSLGGGCGRGCQTAGFSSRSLGGGLSGGRGLICGGWGYAPMGRTGEGRGIHAVRVDANLLRPLCIQIDPEISRVKEAEREEIKTLNDKFAGFIDKVRHVEQQNKLLETKWNCLQQQAPKEKKTLDHLFTNYLGVLQRQLDRLLNDREQLQLEKTKFQEMVEDYKCKYEAVINRRVAAENEFVVLKKVSCSGHQNVGKAFGMGKDSELNCWKCLLTLYWQELESLQTTTEDTNVIVSMDNSRELDMEGIIDSVRCQYEEIAQRSKDEVNSLYESKSMWGRQCKDLCGCRREIQDLTRLIQRLKGDMETTKKQIDLIQTSIADNEQRGECALKDAKAKLTEMENALQSAKDELACLLRDYQKMLNVKMGLDIEIEMYRSLLEGEETVVGCPNISVPAGPSGSDTLGGSGFGRSCTYGNIRRSARFSSKSGKLPYKTGYSSRSGGQLSRCPTSSGFGQCGVNAAVPCEPIDCGPVDVGCAGGGGYSSRSRRYCQQSRVCISSEGGLCSTGLSGGSSLARPYPTQSKEGCTGGSYAPGSSGGLY